MRPEPVFVKPPAPTIVPPNRKCPAVPATSPTTFTTTVSLNTIGVLSRVGWVEVPAILIVTGPEAASKVRLFVAVPTIAWMPFAVPPVGALFVIDNEPSVTGTSSVKFRAPPVPPSFGLVKMADAPTAFGTPLSQLAPTFHVPAAGLIQV